MDAELYLVAPIGRDPVSFRDRLAAVLDEHPVAALLLPEDERSDDAVLSEIATLLPLTQPAGCALLVENRAHLVRPSGADGVHVGAGENALREALAMLKPDHIVGCGRLPDRDAAMAAGEAGADYVMFGDTDDPKSAETAEWWAETFEVPSVWVDGDAQSTNIDSHGCEFIALSMAFWAAR